MRVELPSEEVVRFKFHGAFHSFFTRLIVRASEAILARILSQRSRILSKRTRKVRTAAVVALRDNNGYWEI